jgi:hypothetical protein
MHTVQVLLDAGHEPVTLDNLDGAGRGAGR